MEHLISPDLLYEYLASASALLILLFGVHPTTAVGTDLLFAASTKATGTIVHAAARTVDWMLVSLLDDRQCAGDDRNPGPTL